MDYTLYVATHEETTPLESSKGSKINDAETLEMISSRVTQT